MALELTVGTNTYATLTEADAYFEARLFCTAWTGATSTTKNQALAMACRKLDALPLKGVKKLSTQTLAFPRCYRLPYATQTQYAPYSEWESCETDVPDAVKQAQFEEALALLDRGDSGRVKLQQQGVQAFSTEGLSETYHANAGAKTLLSPEAEAFLMPYLLGAVEIR